VSPWTELVILTPLPLTRIVAERFAAPG
jgi:hypothetical protein